LSRFDRCGQPPLKQWFFGKLVTIKHVRHA